MTIPIRARARTTLRCSARTARWSPALTRALDGTHRRYHQSGDATRRSMTRNHTSWAATRARLIGTRLEIGAPGFEPGTSPTRTVRATRLRHAPKAFESRRNL